MAKMSDRSLSKASISTPGAGKEWVKLWPLVFLLILYLPGMAGWVPFPSPEAGHTDLLVSHYPNALYLRDSLVQDRQIPLWSTAILSGYPFGANPLSGLWYPGGWMALLFPLPAGITLLLAGHVLSLGAGGYYFLQQLGLEHKYGLIGAAAMMAAPKVSAHYGAGHISLIYAYSWTPWLLWAVISRKHWTWEAGLLALIITADPRWGAYGGILWLAYKTVHRKKGLKSWAGDVSRIGIGAALLAAPLLFPLGQYTRLTTRGHMTAEEVFTQSLPLSELLGLFYPQGGGNPEWEIYLGGMTLILAVLGTLSQGRKQERTFWITAGAVSLVWSLGEFLPGSSALARVPGLNLLRVPPRGYFAASLGASILAAFVLEDMETKRLPEQRARKILFAVVVFTVLLGIGIGIFAPSLPGSFIWGLAVVIISAALLFAGLGGGITSHSGLVLILIVIMGDGLATGFINIDYRELSKVNQDHKPVLDYVADQQGRFRVYSPSYSNPQHLAVRNQLQLAEGVDPLQLERYAEFMERATGIPRSGYSVSIPPWGEKAPGAAHRGTAPDPRLLGLLNVQWVTSEYELNQPGLEETNRINTTWIYRNLAAAPRAWVEHSSEQLTWADFHPPETQAKPAEITQYSPNAVGVTAAGPGILVLSEIAYPGWKVFVDGDRKEMVRPYALLRGVEIGPGNHQIRFTFRPASVAWGLAVSLATAAAMIAIRKKGRAHADR